MRRDVHAPAVRFSGPRADHCSQGQQGPRRCKLWTRDRYGGKGGPWLAAGAHAAAHKPTFLAVQLRQNHMSLSAASGSIGGSLSVEKEAIGEEEEEGGREDDV